MSKELKMEVFASKEPVKSVKLHVYEFHTSELYENKYRLIRSAVWKMRNVNACGVFEDGSYIYTTEKISEEIPNATFRLTYLGEQELNVLDHKKVYSELIKHWITQKLRTVKIQKNSKEYYKYACRSNVTSRWIQTEKGFQTFYSGNRQISLERKYNFTVKILDDGKAYLKIDTSSVFSSNQTVYDYITQGMNPIGMEVKNEWGKNNQTGILTEICDYTVVDKIDFADSLKAYYTDMKKEGYRVENLPDQTPVVRVELQVGKIYPYYPQALKPVLTREKVGQIDARFSMAIEKYIKRDMITRIELDKDFIRDIGSIAQLGDLEFENDMCNVKELGYLKGKVESPALTCGQGKRLRCGEEFKVFNYGFYQKPDEKIKIGYIYPKNTVDLIKTVVNGICEFAAYGKYQGEKDAYIIPGLLDIQMKPMIKEEYELGDITDYKRAAQRLRKVEGIDIVIGIVPDGMDEDGPYNPFKTIWAEANIPSQMISMKTAQLFYRGKREGNKSKYYLHNIVLGILGKTGGIPWVIKEMPGNVDCFVGLDVATLEKGIHYPACSVVFDKSGRLLGFYKPKSAQRGEKIETRILQDIFDQVLLSYEDKFGERPKNIMIHRDGFSNENDAWYEKYFGAKGIAYTIVEVRKNISSKLAIIEDGVIKNPEMGYCIYNKSDSHAKISLLQYGLIELNEQNYYVVSEIGDRFIALFDDDNNLVADREEFLNVTFDMICIWHQEGNGFDIHPGKMIIRLMLEPELHGYFTDQDLACICNDTDNRLDSQYEEIKEKVIAFRESGVIYTREEKKKTYTLLTGYANNWNIFELDEKSTNEIKIVHLCDDFRQLAIKRLSVMTEDKVPTDDELKTLIRGTDELSKSISDWEVKYGIDGRVLVTHFTRVKQVQDAFRNRLMAYYGRCCMMCGIRNKEMLKSKKFST